MLIKVTAADFYHSFRPANRKDAVVNTDHVVSAERVRINNEDVTKVRMVDGSEMIIAELPDALLPKEE